MVNSGRLLLAIAASAAIVLATPFVGQLRSAIVQAFPGQFALIIASAIAIAIGLALLVVVRRIRDRHRLRYGALVMALAIGVLYSMASRTGNANVDAVERFHFVEYGLITLLFWRAWAPLTDVSRWLLPLLAALAVGIAEEWLQWFVPARVGELRDIFLNLWAIGTGLLFSFAFDPPTTFEPRIRRESWAPAGQVAALVLLMLAVFIDSVHLGHRIDDGEVGIFESRYRSNELLELSQARSELWRQHPPLTWARLSQEDQYMTEGVVRVQRRNEAWQEGDFVTAWHENLILERYFAPVLDTPSYISATGHRWSAEHRADAERRYVAPSARYYSEADDPPVFAWSRAAFWILTIAVVLLIGFAFRRL